MNLESILLLSPTATVVESPLIYSVLGHLPVDLFCLFSRILLLLAQVTFFFTCILSFQVQSVPSLPPRFYFPSPHCPLLLRSRPVPPLATAQRPRGWNKEALCPGRAHFPVRRRECKHRGRYRQRGGTQGPGAPPPARGSRALLRR